MKRFAVLSVIAMAMFALLAVSFNESAEARRYRRGALVGVGAAALVAGAIIAGSQSARADSYRGSSYSGPRHSCRELRWKCEDGSNWACRRYDDRC